MRPGEHELARSCKSSHGGIFTSENQAFVPWAVDYEAVTCSKARAMLPCLNFSKNPLSKKRGGCQIFNSSLAGHYHNCSSIR